VLTAAAWVALVDHTNFAGEWAVGGVEAKCFAYGFVLLGLAAVARGEWKTPWLWFGAAAAFHVLVGGWAALAAGGAWLAEPRNDRPALRSLLPSLVFGAALSLPGLIPALALDRGAPAEAVREAARIYVFDRLPHHLAPLSLPQEEIRARLLRFGVVGLVFLALWAWTVRGAANSTNGAWRPERLLRVCSFAAFGWLANVAGLAMEWLLTDRPLLAASVLRYYWFRLADVVLPMAVAIGAAAMLSESRRGATKWARPVAAFAALVAGAHLVAIVADRWQRPWPPAVARMDDYLSWRSACEWIRDNAPADAVCIVPRHAYSFKWYAERADVVNWKDIPQNAEGLLEWRRRLDDLYTVGSDDVGQAIILGSPEQWGVRRVREVAARYGARFVLARIDPPLSLRRVYPEPPALLTDWYAVYDLGLALPLEDSRSAPSSVPP
jgi:hypothetical protein